MKVLVFTSSSLCDPHFGMQLEEAESLFREGNEVSFVYCDGFLSYCCDNLGGDSLYCKYCRFYTKTLLKKNLSPGINIIPLKRKGDFPALKWEYTTVKDIKNIVYKNVGYKA